VKSEMGMEVGDERGKCTVMNITILDLLENFGPYGCVAFFVFFNGRGFEVEKLRDAARALGCRCHCCIDGGSCLHALRTFKLVVLMVVDASGGELLHFAAAKEPGDT
jgi:hypothetical protein